MGRDLQEMMEDIEHDECWGSTEDASPSAAAGYAQKPARCHECGRFVSKKELEKVPTNGVPWCDDCVSGAD